MTVSLTKAENDGTGTYHTIINNLVIFIDDIYSRKLVYNANLNTGPNQSFTGTLAVADNYNPIQILSTFTNGDNVFYSIGAITLAVNHPYAADAAGSLTTTGTYMDTTFHRDYIRFATPFTIVHGWGETNRGLIDKWGAIPDAELPFQPNNGCDRCGTDYHQSAGDEGRIRLAASWLVQASKAARLHASIANSIYTHHHTIGIVVADANVTSTIVDPGQTPQILNYGIADSFDRLDAETGFSVTSKTSTATDRRVAIHAIAATEDALEGSVVAQNADLPDTVSTATRFEWGNSPPAAEDPSAIPSGSIGPRKFYDFTQANASTAQVNAVTSVMLVEGKLTTTSSDTHPGDNPTIGPNETGLRQSDNAQLITSYASLGFDVVASEEAFLGPGQRAGYFTLAAGTTLYSHANSKQRGGAFVATLYDPATGDPVQIAHIGANVGDFGPVGIKGGGGRYATESAVDVRPGDGRRSIEVEVRGPKQGDRGRFGIGRCDLRKSRHTHYWER